MKIFIFICTIILLFCASQDSYAQWTWQGKIRWDMLEVEVQDSIRSVVRDSLGTSVAETIQDSIAFPVDTTALKLLNMDEGRMAYLKQLSSANTNGGGWFVVKDSTYDEQYGGVAFSHPTSGLQWVRIEYLDGAVNVLWFGALDDSSGSSTSAFISAKNAATANGQEIYIPPGQYKLSSGYDSGDFFLPGGYTLYSQNFTRTLNREIAELFPSADGDTVLSVARTGASYNEVSGQGAIIRNITINGIAGTDTGKVGLLMGTSNDADMSDLVIKNFSCADTGYGLVLDSEGPNSVNFTRIVSTNNDYNLWIDDTDGIYFNECRFLNPQITNVYIADALVTNFISSDFELGVNSGLHSSAGIKNIVLQYARETAIFGGYMEASGTDSLETMIDIQQWNENSAAAYFSSLNIYGMRILASSVMYPIDVNSQQGCYINLYGGELAYKSLYDRPAVPIAASDTVTNVINLHSVIISTESMPAGGKTYTIFGYDSAGWDISPRNLSVWDNPFTFSGDVFFEGSGGVLSGIRTDGAGFKEDANRNVLNMPLEGSGTSWNGTNYDLAVDSKFDTVDIDVVRIYDDQRTNSKIILDVILARDDGATSESHTITYIQQNDGSVSSYFNLDSLYDSNDGAGEDLLQDSIFVENKTTTSFRIVCPMDTSENWSGTRYFRGEVIYGRNIETVTATMRNE